MYICKYVYGRGGRERKRETEAKTLSLRDHKLAKSFLKGEEGARLMSFGRMNGYTKKNEPYVCVSNKSCPKG